MREDGHSIEDIAGRLKRTPRHVERIIEWTEIPRDGSPYKFPEALENRVLALRAEGESHEQIAGRFKRTARNIRQIEAFAHYRQALEMLRDAQ